MWFGGLAYIAFMLVHVGAESTESVEAILAKAKGGVLVKDGKLTSCELGVITNVGAMVSPDCLDYNSDGTVNMDTTYKVHLDNGGYGNATVHTVTNVQSTYGHNSTSLANNYVYLDFDTQRGFMWMNALSPMYEFKWDSVVLVRRTLVDMEEQLWGQMQYTLVTTAADPACSSYSNLFKDNNYLLLCDRRTTPSPSEDLVACDVPYGTVYGIYYDEPYLIGIYSYSAISGGDDLCSASDRRNYYSVLDRWFNYKANVDTWTLDTRIGMFAMSRHVGNRDFMMTNSTGAKSNVAVVHGDLYKDQAARVSFDTPIIEAETSLASLDSPNPGGLTMATKVAIGVCIPVAVLSLLVSAYLLLLVARKKAKQAISIADPVGRNALQNMLETELGGPSVPPVVPRALMVEELPPTYDGPVAQQATGAPYEDIKEMEFISEKGCFQLEKSDDIDIDLGQLVGSCVIVKVVFRPGSLYYSTDGLYGNVPQGTVSWFNKILGEDMEVMEGLSR
ncbi:hypothetical protein GGF46_001405 [Coemansia sp. RSA 552]|nr:hypothetical protein GGF46_001405 [Coemansia sp. RSA 552]